MPYKDRKTQLLRAKLRYDERKSKGLCCACGEKNDRTDSVYCSWCTKKRALNKKSYLNGSCGHHDCTTCPYPYCIADEKKIERREKKRLETTRKSFDSLVDNWKKHGLCIRCGGEIDDGLKSYCRKCQDKLNANARKWRKKHSTYIRQIYYDGNLCHICHKLPVVDGYNTCEKCLEICRNRAKKCHEHFNTGGSRKPTSSEVGK